MNIKKLYLVRHADYGSGSNPSLSGYGIEQSRNLGQHIKADLGPQNTVIWTSSAARALETAQLIKQELSQAELIVHEKLWSDNQHRQDFKWLQAELEKFEGDSLIIVSHLEYVREFPTVLGFPENNAGYANGVLIQNGKCIRFA